MKRTVTDAAAASVLCLSLWVADDLTLQTSAEPTFTGPWKDVYKKIYNEGCGKEEFACSPGGPCIPYSWTCDVINDCPNGADEVFHTPLKGKAATGPAGAGAAWAWGVSKEGKGFCGDVKDCNHTHQFNCTKGGKQTCIPAKWKCDTTRDCDGGEDEAGCSTTVCGTNDNQFNCGSGNNIFDKSTRCIPKAWECDTVKDCTNGADEHDKCPPSTSCTGPNQFQCRSVFPPKCISATHRCDVTDDCGDLSDEVSCPYCFQKNNTSWFSVFNYTDNVNKTSTQYSMPGFHCYSNRSVGCIADLWTCDTVNDCGDDNFSEDENTTYCEGRHGTNRTTWPNIFTCKNGSHTSRSYVCDYVNDCGDWSDEQQCSCDPTDPDPDQCGIQATCLDDGQCACKPAFIVVKPNGKKICPKTRAGSRARAIHGSSPLVMLMTAVTLLLTFLEGGLLPIQIQMSDA